LKYADPSYSNLSRGAAYEGNYIFNFIYQQKGLMKKGYSKEKAFEMVFYIFVLASLIDFSG